jgi:hypothetical protein
VEDTQLIFGNKPGMRKIILSTNIAESSVTIPDIQYVIDFCLTKNLMCDMETNYVSLKLQWADKNSCIQVKLLSSSEIELTLIAYFLTTQQRVNFPSVCRLVFHFNFVIFVFSFFVKVIFTLLYIFFASATRSMRPHLRRPFVPSGLSRFLRRVSSGCSPTGNAESSS